MPDNDLQAGLDSFLAKESEFKATTLRNNWANTSGTSPDDFAKQIALSRATGIPAQSLAADPEEARRHETLQGTDFTGLVTSAPKTTNFLLDPKNAGLYRDKAPELSAIEKMMAGASYLGGSTVAGLHDLAGAGAKLLDAVNPFTLSDQDAAVLFKDQPEKLQQMREKSAAMGLSRFARRQTEKAEKTMEGVSPAAKATYGGLKYATTDTGEAAYLSPIKVVSDALRSLPTSAALATTIILTRGAALKAEQTALASGATAEVARQAGLSAATNMAVKFGAVSEGTIGYAQQALQTQHSVEGMSIDKLSQSPEFQKLLDQGYDENVARIFTAARAGEQAGVGAGFVDAITNAIGGKFLGKIIGEGGNLIPRILKGFANEAGVEFVQSGGEQLFENIAKQANANPGQELSENVIESMLQGLFVGGLTGGAFSGILGRAANETAVEGDAQHLADLFATAAQVHDRDPETFKQFFQTIAPDATVLIDPDKLQEVLLQADIDPAKLPSFIEQANTSQAGAGIEIPVHELIAAFTGTGAEAALIPHVRFGADMPTLAESREAGTKAAEFFQKEADRILEEQSRNEEFVAGAKAVQDDIKAQLDSLGRFGPQATSGYAALTGAFYTTMASQLGVTPLQLRDGWTDAQGVARKGYKLTIGGEQNVNAAQSLNQLEPATRDTFTGAGIPNLLKTDNWTILTAENPNAQKLSPKENAARNAELQRYLTAQGYEFTPVKGHYGQPENSFVVTGITPEQAQALAKKFEQESVLTRHGLVYQDGSITPSNGLTVHPSQPEDYYTKLPDGTTFTVGLDFKAPRKQLSDVLNQTARDFQTVTPAQIDAIRKSVAWTETGTENGFPIWKNAQVALTSPVDVTEGHDVFYKPLGNERAVRYQIQDANGRSVGYTVLELADGWPTLLLDIEVTETERGKRYAEQTVAAIANDAGELGIWHIVPSARSWWERIGAAPVDEHNGTIDFNGYADARASRENQKGVGEVAFNQSRNYSGLFVKQTAVEEKTGKKVTYKTDAQEAMDDVDARIKFAEELKLCLAS